MNKTVDWILLVNPIKPILLCDPVQCQYSMDSVMNEMLMNLTSKPNVVIHKENLDLTIDEMPLRHQKISVEVLNRNSTVIKI